MYILVFSIFSDYIEQFSIFPVLYPFIDQSLLFLNNLKLFLYNLNNYRKMKIVMVLYYFKKGI